MTHRIDGQVDDYDLDGKGDTLASALDAYAADCRRAALSHQKRAELMLAEAERAERAAVAAEMTSSDWRDLGEKP